MKIGIMGAMPEEVDVLRQHLTDVKEVEHGRRNYYCGFYGDHEVVLVFSKCGKVAAASTAMSLIETFAVNQIIFTGVAGAVAADLNIGDIVISTSLYQHDMDASPIFPRHQVPLTDMTFFNADQDLIGSSAAAASNFIKRINSLIPASVLAEFKITEPKLLQGVITSGDQFVTDPALIEQLLQEKPETLAIEMEGAAVAQVCYDHDLPFVVIRTISDEANHQSHIDFPRFINEVANHYAEHIVVNMLKE